LIKGMGTCQIIHKDSTGCTAQIAHTDAVELFTASQVPHHHGQLGDLCFHRHGHRLAADAHPDGADIAVVKEVINKTTNQAGLAYSKFAEQTDFLAIRDHCLLHLDNNINVENRCCITCAARISASGGVWISMCATRQRASSAEANINTNVMRTVGVR